MTFSLLGRKLGHSYSPRIHKALGNNNYQLFEKEPSELANFFNNPDLQGVNITIPYKIHAMDYCAHVDERAKRIGCVNTMVRENGQWYGYNTDYDGFIYTLTYAGISVKDKQCLILGDGASSQTVHVALEDLGAREIIHVSRHAEPFYNDAPRFYNTAEIIINCTPVGMYPHGPANLVDLTEFTKLEGVVDLIYNPRRTVLLLQAEMMNIPHADGLPFLVAQGVVAANYFQHKNFSANEITTILKDIANETENIILIGMPGVGKSTVGKALSEALGRPWVDIDQELSKDIGDISSYIIEHGEEAFRLKETELIAKIGKESGHIISTGGGCVTVPKNFVHLRQNGRIYQLKTDVENLEIEGRVLSTGGIDRLREIEAVRTPMYEAFAQVIIDYNRNLEETITTIIEEFSTYTV